MPFNIESKVSKLKAYEELAQKVIYMTATPKPLLFENFDQMIYVSKEQSVVNSKIVRVKSITPDLVSNLAYNQFYTSDVVCIHNNNKKQNRAISDHFRGILNETKQILIEEHQENYLGHNPNIEKMEIERVSVLSSEDKESKEYQHLTSNSTFQDDTKLFISTSFIKAGMNINNTKRTSIIIVCDTNDFTYIDQIQTVGRYRKVENIDNILFVVRERSLEEMAGKSYTSFEEMHEQNIKAYDEILKTINQALKDSPDKETIAKTFNLTYDPVTNEYKNDYQGLIANEVQTWANSMLSFPNVLKKELENELAINIKATIEDYAPEDVSTNIADKLKENIKADKETFKQCVKQVLTYDNLTLKEILNYNLDQRHAENKEAIENMKTLHKLMSQSWKSLYKQVLKDIEPDEALAFRIIATRKHKDIKNDLKQHRIKQINKMIKEMGFDKAAESELIFKKVKANKDIAMVIRIRKELIDIEKKRSSISKKRTNNLVHILINERYLSNKKDIEAHLSEITELLNMIYTLDAKTQISSIKY